MSSPQEGRGSIGSSPSQTISSVDTDWSDPNTNTTGHGTEVILEPTPGVIGLATDGTKLRLQTSSGFFRFIDNTIHFPHGQRLSGFELGDNCTSIVTVDTEDTGRIAPSLIPIATSSMLGGVIIGSGISVAVDGTISVVPGSVSPLTTKGDLWGYSTVNARVPVGTNGQVLTADSTQALGLKWSNATGGTVTSVALTVPGELSVSGSPITSSGTLALSWASQTTNKVFAAPNGSTGTPTFRALVSADIPNLDTSKITTGLLSTARGGTGVDSSTATNGQLLIGTGSGLSLHTLTAGTGVTITNASGTITIASTGGGGGSSTLAGDTDVLITSPVGGQVLGYNSTDAKWENQNVAGVAATQVTSQLSSNVAMGTANTYFDGPSITLPPGTWFITSEVTVNCPTSAANISAKLWDGTTAFASQEVTTPSGGADTALSLSALTVPTTTTTYKVSVRSGNNLCNIQAAIQDGAAGNNASSITAIQLSGNPVGQLAPAVRCYASGVQSLPNSTYTAITFDVNQFDQGVSTPQHSTTSNTSRLTCQQTGIYDISALVTVDDNGAGSIRVIRLRVNGSTDIAKNFYDPLAAQFRGLHINQLYQLTSGDYVEALVFQDSGGTRQTASSGGQELNHFMMARIDSGPGAVQPNTKVQLSYTATTDLLSSTAVTNATWTNILTVQSFVVDDPNSVIEIETAGAMAFVPSGGACDYIHRINVDNGIYTQIIGAEYAPTSGITNRMPLSGTMELAGLSAGPHTVTVQFYATANGGSAFLRAATQTNTEALSIRVLERKVSSSPPSSTPAPAVQAYNSSNISIPDNTNTVLTFDSTLYDQGTSSPQHSNSTNNSRLTCQQAGIYHIVAAIQYNNFSNSGQRIILIRLNGSIVIADNNTSVNSSSSGNEFTINIQYHLNVGDYVEAIAAQDSGTTGTINASTKSLHFMMARMDSGPGAVQPNTKVQLDYALTTDLGNPSISATTWTDVISNQTFNVDDSNSEIEIAVSGNALVGSLNIGNIASRVVVDSASTNIIKKLGGGQSQVSGQYQNALMGSDVISLTGLTAGSHTIKVQVFSSIANKIYLEPVSSPDFSSLQIRVLERKQSVCPPGSLPAPAIRVRNNSNVTLINNTFTVITFDTIEYDQGTSTPQHSNSVNPSRITCQQAGVYSIVGQVEVQNNNSTFNYLEMRLNGTTDIASDYRPPNANSDNARLTTATQYHLNVGDYIEILAFQNSGSNRPAIADTDWSPVLQMARVDTGAAGGLSPIEKRVLSASAPSITFSSIPQGYSHLKLVLQGRGDAALTQNWIQLQFNGDTGSNYNYLEAEDYQGSAGAVTRGQGVTSLRIGHISAATAVSGYAGTCEIEISNYAGTVFKKTAVGVGGWNAGTTGTGDPVASNAYGDWTNTAAITSITMFLDSGNFVAGTTVSLYGLV